MPVAGGLTLVSLSAAVLIGDQQPEYGWPFVPIEDSAEGDRAHPGISATAASEVSSRNVKVS
jgi:hypothetical protein